MKKNQSIFRKIINKVLPIWIIPCIILLLLLYSFECVKIKNDEYRYFEERINSYVRDIDISKNNAITKSNYITNSPEIGAFFEFNSGELYHQIINTKKITDYINVINENSIQTIIIYSDNPSILPSQFTENIDKLPNKEVIEEKLKQNNQIFFDDVILSDEFENQYLVLYRRFISENNIIIQIKAQLPKDKSFFVQKNSSEYSAQNNYITVPITDKLIAVTPFDTERVTIEYIFYGLIYFGVGLLFCILLISISYTITSRTTQTINSYISKLSTDELLVNEEDKDLSTDSWELKTIRSAINKLIDENNQKTRAQYKTELEKKRLALNLLQNKIDPHMLYNSLAVISLRANKKQDKELLSLITNLTEYYRSALAQGRDFTTVEDEVDLVRKFVKVNEISHSQAFNFSAEIDASVQDRKLLHLLLQPFVENSIVHGLAGKPEPAIIKLQCYKKEDTLIFKIYDNGYGITPQKLSELNNPASNHKNYAVQNTRERLRLSYGNDSSIYFESKLNEYTVVTIKIQDKDMRI